MTAIGNSVLSLAQQNEIFEGVRTFELDPAEFEWQRRKPHAVRLTHTPTQSYLDFDTDQVSEGHWLSWRPTFASGERSTLATTWPQARVVIAEWLRLVKADHDAPDLWGAIRAQGAISDASYEAPGLRETFSPDELKQLTAGLDEIERFIRTTQPLGPDAAGTVSRRFAYLKDAAAAGGRKVDWLNIFVGTIVSLTAERVLSPEVYGPLMAHAATTLDSVFHLGLRLIGH